jgi:hypothetical protein
MGERNQIQTNDTDSGDDFFDAIASDLMDEDVDVLDVGSALSDKAALANKRRRTEQRLEMLRLREELGDYDFDFEDDS